MNKISILIDALKQMNVNPKHIEDLYALDKTAAFTAPSDPEKTKKLMYGKKKEDGSTANPQVTEEQPQEEKLPGSKPEEKPPGSTPEEKPSGSGQNDLTTSSDPTSTQTTPPNSTSKKITISCDGSEVDISTIVDPSNYILKTGDCNKIKCLIENIAPYVFLQNSDLGNKTMLFLRIFDTYSIEPSVQKLSDLISICRKNHLDYLDRIYANIVSKVEESKSYEKFYDKIKIKNRNTGEIEDAPDRLYLSHFAFFAKNALPIIIEDVFSKKITLPEKAGEDGTALFLKKTAEKFYGGNNIDKLKACFAKSIDLGFSNINYFDSEDNRGIKSVEIEQVKDPISDASSDKSFENIREDYSYEAKISVVNSAKEFINMTEGNIGFGRPISIDKSTGRYIYNKSFSNIRSQVMKRISANLPATRANTTNQTNVYYSTPCILEGLKSLAMLNIVPAEFVELEYRANGIGVPNSSLETRIAEGSAQTECFNKINLFISKYGDYSKKTHPYNFYLSRIGSKSANKSVRGAKNRQLAIELLRKMKDMHDSLNKDQQSYAAAERNFSSDPIVNFYAQTFINKENVITSNKQPLSSFEKEVIKPLSDIFNYITNESRTNFWQDENLLKFVRSGGKGWKSNDVVYLDSTNEIDKSKIKEDSRGKKFISEGSETFFLEEKNGSKNGRYILVNYLRDLSELNNSISGMECFRPGECSFKTDEAGVFNTICAHANSNKIFTVEENGSVILTNESEEKFKATINNILIGYYGSEIQRRKSAIALKKESAKIMFDTLHKYSIKDKEFYKKTSEAISAKTKAELEKVIEENIKVKVKKKDGSTKIVDIRVADPELAQIIINNVMSQQMPGYKPVPNYNQVLRYNEMHRMRDSSSLLNSGVTPRMYVSDYLDEIISFVMKSELK